MQLRENKNIQESGETQLADNKCGDKTSETRATENEKNQDSKETQLSEIENQEESREAHFSDNENQGWATNDEDVGPDYTQLFAGQFNDDIISKVIQYRNSVSIASSERIRKAAMIDTVEFVSLMAGMKATNLDLSYEELILEGIETDGLQYLEWTLDEIEQMNEENGDIKTFITIDDAGNIISCKKFGSKMETEGFESHEQNGREEIVLEDDTILEEIRSEEDEAEVEGLGNTAADQNISEETVMEIQ